MRQHLGMALFVAAATALAVVVPDAGSVPPSEPGPRSTVELETGSPAGGAQIVLAGKPTKDGEKDGPGKGPGKGRGNVKTEPDPTEPAPSETESAMPSTSPFSSATFYVDPHSNARREAEVLRESDPDRAALFDRIGDHSQADWFGDWYPTSEVRTRVAERVATIRDASALPVLVTYAIPARDCGGYSAGGTDSPDGYRAWVDEFAAGLDGGPAAVILEPDALAHMSAACLGSQAAVDERAALLAEAVTTLSARGAAVYLDAGNSAWLSVSEAATRLEQAGVASARGFALNVSNYRTSSESVAYGRDVSAAVGGKPFVVDTSRNGLGPTAEAEWCNPGGRALGERPTAAPTADVDAYLWIKRPGESDGECNGGPRAGAWWPEYAEGLAARAQW